MEWNEGRTNQFGNKVQEHKYQHANPSRIMRPSWAQLNYQIQLYQWIKIVEILCHPNQYRPSLLTGVWSPSARHGPNKPPLRPPPRAQSQSNSMELKLMDAVYSTISVVFAVSTVRGISSVAAERSLHINRLGRHAPLVPHDHNVHSVHLSNHVQIRLSLVEV